MGWGSRMLADSVKGRIRVDSGGFGWIRVDSEQPRRGGCFGAFRSAYGHLDPIKMLGSGFGRGSDSCGFGWTPGPRNWNPPTQTNLNPHCSNGFSYCGEHDPSVSPTNLRNLVEAGSHIRMANSSSLPAPIPTRIARPKAFVWASQVRPVPNVNCPYDRKVRAISVESKCPNRM